MLTCAIYDVVAVLSRIQKSWDTRIIITTAALLSLFCTCIGVGAEGLCVLPAHTIDLGEFPAESAQTATFTVSNVTDCVVQISDLESCCAMVEPVIYDKTIRPGAGSPLDVFIDARTLSGPFRKTITFTANGATDEPVTLWIEGTATPALSIPTPYLFAGWTSLEKPWSTNVTVTIRQGLAGKPVATVESNIGMEVRILDDGPETSCQLQIRVPARQQPISWRGTVTLQIDGNSTIPPLLLHLEGCMGGSLHPQVHKLTLAANEPAQATFKLFRKYPTPPPPSPAPVTCSDPAVRVEEHPKGPEESTVALKFQDDFMQRLKQQMRIPIQLNAAGCTPAILMIEYAP